MPFRFELRPEIVTAFTDLTGDSSSIHTDVEFARRTRFRRPIVHGLLPVAVLLLRIIPERVLGSYWVSQLSCRFLVQHTLGTS
jgi:acyl dehydratase